jgi:integral membrane protein
LPLLRVTSLVEAVSYLVLLGIAMPLKWGFGMPMAVRVGGMIHGVLFLALLWLLMRARIEKGWPKRRIGLVVLASIVPLWPFFLDRDMRQWIVEPAPPAGDA